MSRFDRETIRAKIEWEGEDGVDWFQADEVPEDLQALWQDMKDAKQDFEDLMDQVMVSLYDEE